MPVPDRELEKFLAGVERRAFHMARIATRIDAEALDLVQEAMLSLVKNYRHKASAEWPALFMRILQNKILDWHRKQTRQRSWLFFRKIADSNEDTEDILEHIPDTVDRNPALLLERARDMATVEQALAALPTRQQQAFMLRIWEGLDVASCAHIMGCSEGSVKTHLFRAMQSLRAALGEPA
ncbi:MAG: RNA polymerase sigma factor [Pseudomonadales bacterium]|nr:RNA polymerase sigma factor [Pseudomonadales bacterium]